MRDRHGGTVGVGGAILCLALSAMAAGAQDIDVNPFGGLGPSGEAAGGASHLRVEAVLSHTRAAPGQTIRLAVVVTLEEGWVYYSPDPGPAVKPGSIAVRATGLETGETLWPADHPKVTNLGKERLVNNVYAGRFAVYVPLTVPPETAAGEAPIAVEVCGQICKDVCIDLKGATASAVLKIGPSSAANPAWDDLSLEAGVGGAMTAAALKASHAQAEVGGGVVAGAIDEQSLGLWGGLGLALLAGLILNIMPCVLPVIPLRVLSLVQMAGQSRRRYVTLGLAFAGGMVAFFAAMAVANVVLHAAFGRAFNWSQQWQLPPVRIGMAMVLVAVAANLFGLFTVTVPRRLAALEAGRDLAATDHLGAAGMGLMMAVLATPCSFGILLTALAWAQTQPLAAASAVFLCIGVGMAAPHAVLAAFPPLVRLLPRPGRWMELFRQSMGFLLLLAALFLLGTLAEDGYPFRVAAWGVVLAFALWMFGSWVRYDAPAGRKLMVRGLAVALAIATGAALLRPPAPLKVAFEPFDEARLAAEREAGRTVLVKFTASWCISCRWIDAVVYDDADTAGRLASRRDLVLMKGDISDADFPAARFLRREFPGKAVPLTVIYPSAGPPIRLEGKYSADELFSTLGANP